MNTSQAWIIAAIAVLLIVGLLVFFVRRNRQAKRLTPLTGLAFAFVIAGIAFGDSRLIGYGLMGIGVTLAVVDVFISKREQVDQGHEK
jgi:lipoprotein signal peptidase